MSIIGYCTLLYFIAAIAFFIIALRGGRVYSIKIIMSLIGFSVIWPVVLVVFYLSDRD